MAMVVIYCQSCGAIVGMVNSIKLADGRQMNANSLKPEVLTKPVSELEWKVQATRIKNGLSADGIEFVGQLITKSSAEMMRIPNFGETSVAEVRRVLQTMGLDFGMRTE